MIAQFGIEPDLARNETGGERHDDEMALDPVFPVTEDGVAIAGQRDRLDLQRRLFLDLAFDRLLERIRNAQLLGVWFPAAAN